MYNSVKRAGGITRKLIRNSSMTGKQCFLPIVFLMVLCMGAAAESPSTTKSSQPTAKSSHTTKAKGTTVAAQAKIQSDATIAQALKSISAARIQQTIETLVSFGNRSTLSSTQPAASVHGIYAARDWIKTGLERSSKHCRDLLNVHV